MQVNFNSIKTMKQKSLENSECNTLLKFVVELIVEAKPEKHNLK